MSDVRMLITSTSTTVAQGLRTHITGQRQDRQAMPPFGSPRQAVSWTTLGKGRTELSWEQMVTTTMLLQQQIQELRGEAKTATPPNENLTAPASNGSPRRTNRTNRLDQEHVQAPGSKAQKNSHVTTSPLQGPKSTAPLNPATLPNTMPQRPSAPPAASAVVFPARKQEIATPVVPATDDPIISTPLPSTTSSSSRSADIVQPSAFSPVSPMPVTLETSAEDTLALLHTITPNTPLTAPSTKVSNRDNVMMQVGDDDIAIFEQMRHQLILWLRVEALHAGLEISDQSPPQLLEMLRHQERYDDTRLQVVSTLLNLANQVIKNGRVSVIDYKQALTFYLMHTRR